MNQWTLKYIALLSVSGHPPSIEGVNRPKVKGRENSLEFDLTHQSSPALKLGITPSASLVLRPSEWD